MGACYSKLSTSHAKMQMLQGRYGDLDMLLALTSYDLPMNKLNEFWV